MQNNFLENVAKMYREQKKYKKCIENAANMYIAKRSKLEKKYRDCITNVQQKCTENVEILTEKVVRMY